MLPLLLATSGNRTVMYNIIKTRSDLHWNFTITALSATNCIKCLHPERWRVLHLKQGLCLGWQEHRCHRRIRKTSSSRKWTEISSRWIKSSIKSLLEVFPQRFCQLFVRFKLLQVTLQVECCRYGIWQWTVTIFVLVWRFVLVTVIVMLISFDLVLVLVIVIKYHWLLSI